MKGIPVLFENDSCMVLDKPPGLAVQGGEGLKISLDLILSQNYNPRPLLVHRLDRDTSGLILVAKSKEAAGVFSSLFAERQKKGRFLRKIYLGLCYGIPEEKSGTITAALDVRGKDSIRVKKESETFYKVISSENTGLGDFSLLELELGTGRMHQIRRHLAYIGHPLLGDDKYGDFSLNKRLKKAVGLKQLLLHASRLTIPPLPGLLPDGLDIKAPLPEYFSLVGKFNH